MVVPLAARLTALAAKQIPKSKFVTIRNKQIPVDEANKAANIYTKGEVKTWDKLSKTKKDSILDKKGPRLNLETGKAIPYIGRQVHELPVYGGKRNIDKAFTVEADKAAAYHSAGKKTYADYLPSKTIKGKQINTGSDSQHYLRKHYMREGKFTDKSGMLPKAQLDEMKSFLGRMHGTFSERFKRNPTMAELHLWAYNTRPTAGMNHEKIIRALRKDGYKFSTLKDIAVKEGRKLTTGSTNFEKLYDTTIANLTKAGIKNPTKQVVRGHSLRKTYYKYVPENIREKLVRPQQFLTAGQNSRHIHYENTIINNYMRKLDLKTFEKKILNNEKLSKSETVAFNDLFKAVFGKSKKPTGSLKKDYQAAMKGINNELNNMDKVMSQDGMFTTMYDPYIGATKTFGKVSTAAETGVPTSADVISALKLAKQERGLPVYPLKKGGRVGYAKGGRVGYSKGGGVDIGSLANIKDSSKVGTFQSVLAGIGSGLIDIPKGAFSLGAALIDMGLGTNHAAQVESFFDDLTTLDEKAEATTAGKITRIMTNLGVPGTAAFKIGSRLTKQAMAAKDKGNYFTITKNTAGELEKVLTTKGRMLTTLGGVAGVGASDAIFVGDAENVGTLGDAFNIGPTQLLENDENIASRTVMNRIKFGIDSAMLGGLIGGTGTAIGLAVKRSKNLKRNNDFIDKILDYTTPQGAKSREFFDLERGMTGQRSADLNRAQEIQRQLDKHVDGLYPFISRVSSFGVQKQREAVMKTINEALTSTVKGPRGLRVEGSVPTKEMLESGEEIIAPLFTLGDMSPEALAAVKKIKGINSDEVIKLLTHSRKIMDNSFTDIASNIYRNSAKTSEARANVLEKFAAFKKGFETKAVDYINDTWRIFGNKNVEALKGFKPTEEAVTNAKELFKQLAIKRTGKTMTDQEAAYQVDRLIESAKPQNKFLVEGSTVPLINDETGFLKDIAIKDWKHAQLPLNKVMGEITKDGVPLIGKDKLTPRKVIEDLFGKVDDASSTVLSALNNLSIIRRKHEFYGNFHDQFFGKQLFNTRREAAQVFGEKNVGEKVISMNQTGHGGKLYLGDAVNPLDGKWTSKGIQDALEGTNRNLFSWTEDGNLFSSLYNNLILYPKATSQLAKTVLSPITHVRNLISAGAFAAANGIMPLVNKEALDEAFGAMRQVGARGNEAANKRYRELLRLGVVNRNARLGDLEDLLADVDFGSKFSQIRALRGVTKKLSKFKQTATDAYTAEDDFWKMFTFSAERQRIAKALNSAGIDRTAFAQSEKNDLGRAFGTFDEYLDEAAANVVRNNVPNYDYVSRFIKDLRRAPMGNFVSFPAEIIRTSINIVKKGLDEIQYVDPITGTKPFKNIGMQRLLGYGLTTVAVPYGTVEAFKAAYNVSGVEMDALRRFVPDWSKNSTLVPIKDDDGNFKYIDFSHANAYDTMIRPVQSILNAVADGRTDTDTVMEDFMQGVVTATSELGQPFISESIWTQALGDIFVRGGRTKDGKRLYTDQTPFGDRFWEASKHLVEAQTPLNLKQFGRLTQGVTGSPDEYGRTYELPDEMLGFAGLRAVKVDPVTSMKFKIADFTRGQSEARAEFTKNLLKGGPVTAEEIVDRYKTANEAMFNVQKNLSQDYYGALVLGAGAKAINNEFADRVSRTQLNSIIRGNFQPFIPSENVEKAFSDNAKKLDLPNPYREAAATIKKMANMYKKMKLFSQVFPDIPNPFSGSNVSLPTAGMNFNNQVMNLGKTEQPLFGQSINQNTMTKGQQVFGPNDTVFGA